eukprot:SAG25_NODE_512_length_7283_cov_3.695573_1_plen_21_part_10
MFFFRFSALDDPAGARAAAAA